jgi:hypothetical protein
MMLLDKWQRNQARVRQAGLLALEQAKQAGVAAYYRDPSAGDGLVKELPDGSRVLVDVTGQEERVTAILGPRG